MSKKIQAVRLDAIFPNEKVESCTHIGSFLTIKINRRIFGISPIEIDAGSKSVTLKIFRMKSMSVDKPEVDNELEILIAKLGRKIPLSRRIPFEIEVNLKDENIMHRATGTCCVRCDNITACGCAVSMSCGSCCVGECC